MFCCSVAYNIVSNVNFDADERDISHVFYAYKSLTGAKSVNFIFLLYDLSDLFIRSAIYLED